MTFRPPLLGIHLGVGSPGAGPTTAHLKQALLLRRAIASAGGNATPKKSPAAPAAPAKDGERHD